ncbi:MAG: metalloregulator ArsR/SmtB family transcription factor [Acidimicrobiales bacterium]
MTTRDVYTAIADPTRREILDLLRTTGNLPAGKIAAHFPQVSRPAVSRHLRVLRECAVVSVEQTGKQHHYSLDRRPLAELRRGWLAGFSERSNTSLRALRKGAESQSS